MFGSFKEETCLETAIYAPLRRVDGYLPLKDYGLIGDGATAALVGRDGEIPWLCAPRFDSPPLFCGILDRERGGAFTVAPEDLVESRQSYEPDTGVLLTEMRSRSGVVRVTDALTLRSGADLNEDAPAARGELLRSVRVLKGSVRLRVVLEPRGDATIEPRGDGLRLRLPFRSDLDLQLWATAPLGGLRNTLDLEAGDRLSLVLRWGARHYRHRPASPDELLDAALSVWRLWARGFAYEGPQEAMVHRSAITLKLLDYFESGAIVAAPTTSLPEWIGGERNWDYRYAWIRDAAFSVYALRRIGLGAEAASFLGWVLDTVERHGKPKVLYNLDGENPQPEREDPELEGYRGSRPVRWGNAADRQRQHDVFGEILDCAYQWASHEGRIDAALWDKLHSLVEGARREWREPDHGIWEVRTPGRPFTYSAALCQVALDRGATLAESFNLSGNPKGWRAEAEKIRHAVLQDAWNPKLNAITDHLGGGALDASLLALPLRRVISAGHPRMVATSNAIVERLGAGDGLLYRYLPDESPDGLSGEEGTFLLCSFWLVENLARRGLLDEAHELYDSLCARANPLGLLPEQVDPGSGAFLGNYPQGFSHIGIISGGFVLSRETKRRRQLA